MNGHRHYMPEIIQIRRQTPINQSINQSLVGGVNKRECKSNLSANHKVEITK